jgi:hypothetical protein
MMIFRWALVADIRLAELRVCGALPFRMASAFTRPRLGPEKAIGHLEKYSLEAGRSAIEVAAVSV